MSFRFAIAVNFAVVLMTSAGAQAKGPTFADPSKTDPDFHFQGEYGGEIESSDGKVKVGVQVIALGNGNFRSAAFIGGLPGDGWVGDEKRILDGKLKDGAVIFEDEHAKGELRSGVLRVSAKQEKVSGDLIKVERKSSTLGQKAPEGAVVLFDGTSVSAWEGGRQTEDGLLMEGCNTKAKFGSHKIHVEFRLPYMPQDNGQARGNSGLYLQGRYEIQMLDSFGLDGKQNECGGIYSVKDPDFNMCFPPLTWQTYDVDYQAAKYGNDGKLVANPRITVRHNGVLIHKDVELPGDRATTAAPVGPGPEPGPVYLQNHGDPIRYRNIWVLPTK